MRIDAHDERGDVLDERAAAFHEAAHAVAMWRFGFGVAEVSIVRHDGSRGYARPARTFVIKPHASAATVRATVELSAVYLLAGDVASRLLQPKVGNLQSFTDHEQLHALMSNVEDDAAVQFAWCAYLWQRVFTFISWPGQWYLVVGLAHQLLEHRTLAGAAVERYLSTASDLLKHDPWMPNCVLLGDVTDVSSPFHRDWLERAWETPLAPKRTEIPGALTGLSAGIDVRPIGEVLTSLSTRAYRRLFWAGIRTVADLEDWTPHALSGLKGLGPGTLREILLAARVAGIRTGPDTLEKPWQRNPSRWKVITHG